MHGSANLQARYWHYDMWICVDHNMQNPRNMIDVRCVCHKYCFCSLCLPIRDELTSSVNLV